MWLAAVVLQFVLLNHNAKWSRSPPIITVDNSNIAEISIIYLISRTVCFC
jgi:hypothetical protein